MENLNGTWIGSMLRVALIITATPIGGAIVDAGVVRETGQCQGTITGHTINYYVQYPQNRTNLPVFFHQYGQITEPDQTGIEATNARIAGYGAMSVYVSLADTHCGHGLQDYKDAIDDVYRRYAGKINTRNVTIAGESYGGASTYGMAARFPTLFDAVIPIFAIADFGHDPTQSWYPMVLRNSPSWGVIDNMKQNIGDPATYRDTRYLVRDAVLAAKNNPYAHFEILHDVDDGVGIPGVQVEQSRRYVAELNRLGYTNYRYTETPKTGFVYPQGDTHFDSSLWSQPIKYTHGFWATNNPALYEFELNTLRPNMLSGAWTRPAFAKTGEFFVPSFLEVPFFRFDLGDVANNCDEAANVTYDVSSSDDYKFQIVPQTVLTEGKLQLLQLAPSSLYDVTCMLADSGAMLAATRLQTDAAGKLVFTIPGAAMGATLTVDCVRTIPEPGTLVLLGIGAAVMLPIGLSRRPRHLQHSHLN